MNNQLPHLDDFLTEQANANRSQHTIRAYASDLRAFLGEPTTADLREHFARLSHLSPASRARKQAAFAAYFEWCIRQGICPANPMAPIQRVHLEPPLPRGLTKGEVEAVLKNMKSSRDRLLFRLVHSLGLRISEALGVHVDDLDLTKDDERITVLGKGGRQRTLLLDDPALVRDVKAFIRKNSFKHGLLFRAEKNGTGGAIRYQSIHAKWAAACRASGVDATIHQLRHSHATELINDGVSLATIRKRLGHRQIASTMRYAELSDDSADAELRARRRKMKG